MVELGPGYIIIVLVMLAFMGGLVPLVESINEKKRQEKRDKGEDDDDEDWWEPLI